MVECCFQVEPEACKDQRLIGGHDKLCEVPQRHHRRVTGDDRDDLLKTDEGRRSGDFVTRDEAVEKWRSPSADATVGLHPKPLGQRKENAGDALYRLRRTRRKHNLRGTQLSRETTQGRSSRDVSKRADFVPKDNSRSQATRNRGGNTERLASRNSQPIRRRVRGSD